MFNSIEYLNPNIIQSRHSCPKLRSFEIFPISWLTPVSPYKPIRYSISLSVGYHPVRQRHRVPTTLRCVPPLQVWCVGCILWIVGWVFNNTLNIGFTRGHFTWMVVHSHPRLQYIFLSCDRPDQISVAALLVSGALAATDLANLRTTGATRFKLYPCSRRPLKTSL